MLKRFFVLTCFLCTLSACSYIKKQDLVGDQADAYQKAVADQPLKIPSTLTSSVIGSKTETLPADVQAQSLPSIPPPPGSVLYKSN